MRKGTHYHAVGVSTVDRSQQFTSQSFTLGEAMAAACALKCFRPSYNFWAAKSTTPRLDCPLCLLWGKGGHHVNTDPPEGN